MSNYSFIKSFEITRLIFDQNNSIDSVFGILKNALTNDQIRSIVHCGIKTHTEKCNNFQIVDNIHKEIQDDIVSKRSASKRNPIDVNVTQDSKSNTSSCQKSFKISNVSCNIFAYLDFQSKNDCKTVCMDWLYDLYNCQSNQTLNTNNFYNIDYKWCNAKHCEKINYVKTDFCNTIKHIYDFHKAKNIRVARWPTNIGSYFSSLGTDFKNVQYVTIAETFDTSTFDHHYDEYIITHEVDYSFDEKYTSIILNLLKNNCNNIKQVTIVFERKRGGCSSSLHGIWDKLKLMNFKELKLFKFHELSKKEESMFGDYISCFCNAQSQITTCANDNMSVIRDCGKIEAGFICWSNFDQLFSSSKKMLKGFVQAIGQMYKAARIKIVIHISFRYKYGKEKNQKQADQEKLINNIVDEMKKSQIIKQSLREVKPFDANKISDEWNGEIRWYRTKSDAIYVCDLFSGQIKMTATLNSFILQIHGV